MFKFTSSGRETNKAIECDKLLFRKAEAVEQ